MTSALNIDFVSVFHIPVFTLDDALMFAEVNAAFSDLFGDVQASHISAISDDFSDRKCARKTESGQVYRFKILTADKRKTPYSVDLRRHEHSYIGFAVEAADAAKADALLASYSEMMEKQSRILKAEKSRSEKLLQGVLPDQIIQELQSLSGTTPKTDKQAGLVMLTLPEVSTLSNSLEADRLFTELDELLTCFDMLAEIHSCQRVRAGAEGYLATVTLTGSGDESCESLFNFAADCVELIRLRGAEYHLSCKIGLHIGEVMTGIVGKTQLSFTALGHGIDKVAEIAHHADLMQIVCSAEFYQQSGPLHQALQQLEQPRTELYSLDPGFSARDTEHLHEVMIRAKTLRRNFQ